MDVSVALAHGDEQQRVRVAVGLAHALTVADAAEAASSVEPSLERLCKEVMLERVRVELSHSGATPPSCGTL